MNAFLKRRLTDDRALSNAAFRALHRRQDRIALSAPESIVSPAVFAVLSAVRTNRHAEEHRGNRYQGAKFLYVADCQSVTTNVEGEVA